MHCVNSELRRLLVQSVEPDLRIHFVAFSEVLSSVGVKNQVCPAPPRPSEAGGGRCVAPLPQLRVMRGFQAHSLWGFRQGSVRMAVHRRKRGGGLAQGLGIRLFAFGGAHWPLATAHSDPLWVRTCFGCVNGAPGRLVLFDYSGGWLSRRRAVARAVDSWSGPEPVQGGGGGAPPSPPDPSFWYIRCWVPDPPSPPPLLILGSRAVIEEMQYWFSSFHECQPEVLGGRVPDGGW